MKNEAILSSLPHLIPATCSSYSHLVKGFFVPFCTSRFCFKATYRKALQKLPAFRSGKKPFFPKSSLSNFFDESTAAMAAPKSKKIFW